MEDIFLKHLPSLDLHGFDRDTARVKTLEFINDNKKMKNEIICIVHGRGTGIVKNEIHNTLKNNKILIIHGKGTGLVKKAVHETLSRRKEVIKYHTDSFNDGCTIAYLNVDN